MYRLRAAGVSEDLANPRTLQKAWHGLAPVYRDKDGKFGLDPNATEMGWIICVLDLRPRVVPAQIEPSQEIIMPGDNVPLSREEVDAAGRDRSVESVSVFRRVAASLDAIGGPMSIEDMEQSVFVLTGYRPRITAKDIAYWRGDLVRQNSEGALFLNMESIALEPMRKALRKLAHPVLVQRVQQVRREAAWREQDALNAERKRLESAQAQTLRRALLRVVPSPSHPRAAIVLDMSERSFRFFRPRLHKLLPPESGAVDGQALDGINDARDEGSITGHSE